MELIQQLKDFLLPELDSIRQEQAAVRDRLNVIDLHLVDQSRRIDALSHRIDETNKRIDKIRDDLIGRIDETNKRIDETNKRIDKIHDDLIGRIDESNRRIDEVHRRLDRLYEVIVRRDEHVGLERWVRELSQRIENLERQAA